MNLDEKEIPNCDKQIREENIWIVGISSGLKKDDISDIKKKALVKYQKKKVKKNTSEHTIENLRIHIKKIKS